MSIAKRYIAATSAIVLMTIVSGWAAANQYKIPDDCLGDWDYCDQLWIDGFDRFGTRAFAYLPLPPLGNAIGCRAGRDILARQGFHGIRSIECRAPAYTYLGRWEGHTFRITLSASSGRILNISPN